MAKVKATALSVFTVDGESLLCHTNEVEYEVSVEDEDEACINDDSSKPGAVGRTRRITASGNVEDEAIALTLVEQADLVVAFTMTAGSATVAGNALMKMGSLGIRRRSYQTQRFELLVRGTPTTTVPSA